MKSNNNGVLVLAGVFAAGYFMAHGNNKEVSGISGTESRKTVIKNYLYAMGLPEGQKQLEAIWSKMSTQEIIVDAFRNGILIVKDDTLLRNLLYEKFNFNMGLEKQDSANSQNTKRWRKMTLKQIIADAEHYGIRLLDDTIYKDKSGKRYFPQTTKNYSYYD